MSLQKQIKEETVLAMKAREATKVSVLRGLTTAFINELVSSGSTPQDELNDEKALAVIKREANKRKDSIEQYEKGGRPELAEEEEKELEILQTYLPELMSAEEIKKIAEAKKSELGITDKSKMGMLIGAVMKETKGNADGAAVKDAVEGLF